METITKDNIWIPLQPLLLILFVNMHKNIAQNHGLNSSASSTHILKQLQQNQSLRTQVYKLKTFIKSQSNKHQNTLTSQQMITQKLITSLRMAIKNQISLKKQQTLQQSHQFLCSTIQKCLYDLQNLCELLDSARMECERQMKQNQRASRPQSGRCDRFATINNNGQSFEGMVKQRDITNIKYQTCLKENEQLKRKLLETFEELKSCKLSMNKLQHTINLQKQDIKQKQSQVRKLSDQNDAVVAKIKQNKEISGKHAEYFRKKSEEIQQQNEKLVILHRDAVFRQKELMKIVSEGELQIQKLGEESKRLKLDLQAVELKMLEIIRKQEKIKSLQSLIHSRGVEDRALKQMNNKENIKTPDKQSDCKQTIKMKKKFNLQFFQQKLCSSTTSLVC